MNYWERKQRLPYGEAAKVAARLDVSRSLVSRVMKYGEGSRRVMRALARAMKVPVAVAFPEYGADIPAADATEDDVRGVAA